MPALGPSPWLILAIPGFLVMLYITVRGLRLNQFREPARNGWHEYRRYSFSWVLATATNLFFLTVCGFILKWTLFDGRDFSREPELPMPELKARADFIYHSDAALKHVTECLAEKNHGQVYEPNASTRVIAVRNGRNSTMYAFLIVQSGQGSRVEIFRFKRTPFVFWKSCLGAFRTISSKFRQDYSS